MAIDKDPNSTTTRLLTLLNVSTTRPLKQTLGNDFVPAEKLNKRKKTKFADMQPKPSEAEDVEMQTLEDVARANGPNDAEGPTDEVEPEGSVDMYERHFGMKPVALSESSRNAVDRHVWKNAREKLGALGPSVVSTPDADDYPSFNDPPQNDVLERLMAPFKSRQSMLSKEYAQLQNSLLSALSTRRDLYLTTNPPDTRKHVRGAIALHALNHVTKKRRRVLKNNERLAHAAKTNPDALPPEDVQDQGFTRPSILFLLPFRSTALDWVNALTSHTPSPSFQVENQSRFLAEYGLPPGATDKLATAEPGTYPPDHVETFKGNVDDNFRIGIKLTRKSVKMFAEFYGCDVIMASPLGLRRSIEKEKNADYLTSIEMLIMDQLDTMAMQNWDHVKFVLSHINKLPKESHDTDFSRIKPWYLDGHAAYLRQTILLSAYETPETRQLYNMQLQNVAGKIRTEKRWHAIEVPEGIDQDFVYFDSISPKDEPDKRFHHFTTQILPQVLKSAVQSSNTAIFIPSSFDFIRIQNYLKKELGVSFAVLSEYSSNQDISRARQAFFLGKKPFLLVSERFHFYKRYKIRGIRNLIFYGPPDHPQFFTELLSLPFLDDGVEASDVTCRILYSKYDWFRLERIAGTESALELVKNNR